MKWYVLLFAIAALGCKHPSPLGSFKKTDVASWSSSCVTPILAEDPNSASSLGSVFREGAPAFVHATHRYRCPSPGWSIYTGDGDRVLGVCVDDLYAPRKYTNEREVEDAMAGRIPRDITASEIDRARPMLAAHWGSDLAATMVHGTVGGRCSDHVENVDGMKRWSTEVLVDLDVKELDSRSQCCWEVAN